MPVGGVFERMVAPAEMREVVDVRLSAERGVARMVDIAPPDGLPAAAEPAVLVAHTEGAHEVGARAVPIDGQHRACHGMSQDAIPAGGVCGQASRGLGVDRPVSGEGRARLLNARQREHRNRHLHLRCDRSESAAQRRRSAGEQQVGEDVGATLIIVLSSSALTFADSEEC